MRAVKTTYVRSKIMIPIGQFSEIEVWKKSLVITNVNRDNGDDNRISSCVVYKLGKDKYNQEYWVHINDLSQEEIVNRLKKGWSVKTGKVISGEMDIGADVETELRVKENGHKYPLSGMGRS
jgi:hypothetical protein